MNTKPDFPEYVRRVNVWMERSGVCCSDPEELRPYFNTNYFPATAATEYLRSKGVTPQQEGHDIPALMPLSHSEWGTE